MNLDELKARTKATFRQESEDLLQELDVTILQLEATPDDTELINRIFRAMHTLKGSGATAGFKDLADFLHHVEDAFNAVREGRMNANSELVDIGLKSCDIVRTYLSASSEQESSATLVAAAPILQLIRSILPASDSPAIAQADKAALEIPRYEKTIYRIIFKPHENLFFSGTEPLSLLDELAGLGYAKITGSSDHIPPWKNFIPEHCYLAWEIVLVTSSTADAIKDVFMFVEDECDLEIKPVPYENADHIPAHQYFDDTTSKGYMEEAEEAISQIETCLLTL